MPRVLITGGAGFLGLNVARALVAAGATVVIGDIREPDALPAGTVFARCDVTENDVIGPLLIEHRIDTVVHLAAIMNPGQNIEFEYRVDVEGARRVFAEAAAAGVRRLVVSSSGAAYGYHADAPEWITEAAPLRGNDEISYSRHKRLVEEALAAYRVTHPDMEQVVLRIGTILGPTVKNQITALWDGRRILNIAGHDSPFVFVWVDDVARVIARAATDGPAGVYNVAGTGAMTVRDIARRLGKPLLTVPAWLLRVALAVGKRLRLTPHGAEMVGFLQYRPVLDNTKLREEFGITPEKTSREAFEAYLSTHPGIASAAVTESV